MKQSVPFANPQGPRGVAMLIVIAITGIVALLIGLMMTQYLMRRSAIRAAIQNVQSFYTAESGIKAAFYYLTKDETKGIQWRTGSLFDDDPMAVDIFQDLADKVVLSVVDDCGYLRISSRVKTSPGKTIKVICAAKVPDNMNNNLYLVASKPLILATGSHITGRIKVNQEPVMHGGSIDGILETSASLSMPPTLAKSFGTSIRHYRVLLSAPDSFETELFSPQVFTTQRTFSAKKIFVNDMVLVENRDINEVWQIPSGVTIASTAQVQISGTTKISDATIMAIGPVKIMDQATLNSVRVYSETSIELKEQSSFSGILIAPEIRISERAETMNSTLLYCGAPLKHGRIILETEVPAYCTIFNLCGGEESQLLVGVNTRINGFIYSLAPITLRGEINGYVYCQGFREDPITQDTTNTNIISGVIRPLQSAVPVILPVVFQEISDFRILEWKEW
jgi:hypothetical protein